MRHVEPKERLRKLEDRATMCFFAGCKYDGGGYRVWDLKRRVVAESKDIVFSSVATTLEPSYFNCLVS